MKAKIARGAGFRGALDYALGKGDDAELVGGNMAGVDARALAGEFRLVRQLRPECERPVWHTSLSLPPGERLSPARWDAVSGDFMRIMGLDPALHPFVVVRHHDRDHDHAHIIASRIAIDGSLWLGQWDVRRAIAATQQLERDHGLTLTPGIEDDPDAAPEQAPTRTGRRTPTQPEIEKMDRTDDAPVRLRLQELVDGALAGGPQTVFAFIERLEAAGVAVAANVATTGRMNGFSFALDGVPFKASQLGKAFAWKALQDRGVIYEQDRDGERLVAFADERRGRGGEELGRDPGRADGEDRPAGAGPVDHQHEVRREPRGDGGDPVDGDAPGRDAADRGDDHGRRETEGGRDADQPGGSDHGSLARVDASAPVDGARAGGGGGDGDWRVVADRVADLAAPADPEPFVGGGDAPKLTAPQKAKVLAWTQQHAALGAPNYRLTLKSRRDELPSFSVGKGRGEGGAERFYDAEEVRGLIPYLSRQNVLGRDIYLTPIDPAHHYLVVDDTTPEKVAQMEAEGFRPALVQQSSAGNVQAIIKVPRIEQRGEQKAANHLVVWLNRQWGDPKFSGAVHPFRLAGFSNKKHGREDAFTRVLQAAGGLCQKALEALERARERLMAPKVPPAPREVQEAPNRLPAPHGTADARFDVLRARAEGLVRVRRWKLDQSAVDHRVAIAMLEEDFTAEEIEGAMLRRSPDLVHRHKNAPGYVARTVRSVVDARSAVDEEAAGRLRRPEADDSGPDGPP